ncbi:MAG: hypothetical protein MUE85_06275 [Microscillaceae bacterium]|jgi:hypothetical protein|nr:hypothetical protein [Microscillaceae bacterium]
MKREPFKPQHQANNTQTDPKNTNKKQKNKQNWSKKSNFKGKSSNKMSTYAFIFYALSIFLLVVGVLWIATPEGKVIFTKELTMNELRDTSGYPTPDFEIKRKGVYEFEMLCSVPFPVGSTTFSSELAVDVEVFDSSDVKVNEFAGDLYAAAGYSDGESWRETAAKATQRFLIENPGKYSAEIFASRNTTLQSEMMYDSLYYDPSGYAQYLKVEKKNPIPFTFRVKEGGNAEISDMLGWLFFIFGWIWFFMIFGFFDDK